MFAAISLFRSPNEDSEQVHALHAPLQAPPFVESLSVCYYRPPRRARMLSPTSHYVCRTWPRVRTASLRLLTQHFSRLIALG